MRQILISRIIRNIKQYLGEVTKSGNILIGRRASEDDNSLNETNYLLSTSANRQRLKESIEQLDRNATHKFNLEE